MKVLLINPPRYENIPVIREERCEITERSSILEPYSLLQIGALLKEKNHSVGLMDANGLDLSYDEVQSRIGNFEPEVVIFRFTPTTFDHDMQVAKLSKLVNPDITTIGICWTLGGLGREVLGETPEMDIFIRHEYEVVTPALVDAIAKGDVLRKVPGISFRERGEIIETDDALPIEDYNKLPLPAYELLDDLEPYFINTPVGKPFTILYSSKGCPFKCTYCTVAGTKWKPRSAENVLDELRYLKERFGIQTVSFFDETFTIDKERVKKIAAGTKELEITWYCNTRVNLVDKELLSNMKDGGCRGISYGIESGSQKILDKACKGVDVKQAERAILWAKELGIKTLCSFILGLPGETNQTIDETIKFVKRTKPTGAQFNVLVPYPGTEIYRELQSQGKVGKMDWRELYQHKSVIGTEELTPDDLNRARIRTYRALYFNPAWIGQNIWFILKHPEDFRMALGFTKKIFKNFFINRMKHAH